LIKLRFFTQRGKKAKKQRRLQTFASSNLRVFAPLFICVKSTREKAKKKKAVRPLIKLRFFTQRGKKAKKQRRLRTFASSNLRVFAPLFLCVKFTRVKAKKKKAVKALDKASIFHAKRQKTKKQRRLRTFASSNLRVFAPLFLCVKSTREKAAV